MKYLALLAVAACGHHPAADVSTADAPPDTDAAVDTGPHLPTPIKYVVVIVKENHSFSNYFTGFPGAAWSMTAKLHDGTVITRPKAPDGVLPSDLPHSHSAVVQAYDGGKMDGFDLNVPTHPHLPYSYYTEAQIPNYWAYARNFALFDHFFSTLAGPSSPGHFAVITSQTPHYGNSDCNDGTDDCLSGCLDTTGTTVVLVVSRQPDRQSSEPSLQSEFP